MLRVENNGHLDYSEFDNASTEALQAFLEADFNAPEDERVDVETIIYITKLLCERENAETDVAAAKEVFRQKYYPINDDKFLFDFAEDDTASENKKKVVDIKDFRASFLRHVAGVAVIFVIVLFGGTVTAAAFGYNPWSAIAEWTDEKFWFESTKTSRTAELQQTLDDYGIYLPVAPNWLPQDYKQIDSNILQTETRTYIDYSYMRLTGDEEECLGIGITYHAPEDKFTAVYEKDAAEVITYTVNGIDHYIMYNMDCRTIAWVNTNVECVINGRFSIEEAKKMIDSIYEGMDVEKNLQKAAADLCGKVKIAPHWLPKGYQEVELSVTSDDLGDNIFAVYNRISANTVEELYISISCNIPGMAVDIYEKDANDVDVYTVGGIEHYIMTNLSESKIVWQNGDITGSISGAFNIDEAKKMIDSIYDK